MRNGFSYSDAGKKGAEVTKKILQEKKLQKIAEYDKNPNKCVCCSSKLLYEKKNNQYCSSSCAAKINNLKRAPRENKNRKLCMGCQQETTNPKFCSNKCQCDHLWKVRKNKIEQEKKIDNVLVSKKYLLETRGHVCEICGLTEWQGKPIPLVKDHINGDSTNNYLQNLRLICCNCDAQTEFYKGKNRGRGRAYRRQRYAEGKSW